MRNIPKKVSSDIPSETQYQQKIVHFIDSIKQHEATNTDINVHIKQNAILNIALNIGKDISDNDYGEVSTIDKNAE